MTDPSEFVLVEHDGERPTQPAEWTNVRLEEREPSPVVVDGAEEEVGDTSTTLRDGNTATHESAVSSTACTSDADIEMLKKLQQQLDEESVARFVAAENAKADNSGGARTCDCLGASQGIHRPSCKLPAV